MNADEVTVITRKEYDDCDSTTQKSMFWLLRHELMKLRSKCIHAVDWAEEIGFYWCEECETPNHESCDDCGSKWEYADLSGDD